MIKTDSDITLLNTSLISQDAITGQVLAYVSPGAIGPGVYTGTGGPRGLRMQTDLTGVTDDNFYQFAQPAGQMNLNARTMTAGRNQYLQDKDGDIALTSDIGSTLNKVTAIDATVTGTYSICITPATTGNFIVTDIKLVITSIGAGTLTSAPIVSMGVNLPSYNDIVTPTMLGGSLTPTINHPYNGNFSPIYLMVSPSTNIKVNVSSASVGVVSYVFDVYMRGFYTN